MENRSKILFTDLDDTLLNRQKEITPENRRAIRQAVRRGHRVVLCSGRPLMGVLPQIQALGRELDLSQPGCYAIAYNGGVLYDCSREQVIYKEILPISYVRYIFQKARQYDLFCQTYSDTHLLAPHPSPALDLYLAGSEMPCKIVPSLPDDLKEEPAKVLVIGEDPKRLSAYAQAIQGWAKDKISVFYSNAMYLEHVPLGVSKGAAIKRLCSYLDIPLADTIAAGDEQNDIPMLQTAQIGVAMANATPACKACADYITKNDCDHSGIAEVIDRFML